MSRCESGWSPHFRWAEVDRLSSAKAKEGVASWATVRALRVRFPAWSASARSRHLSIEFFRRAVESGLSVKSRCVGTSGFKPRAIRRLMESQLASCPSSLLGRTQTVIVVQPVERPAWTGKQQVRILPNPKPVRISLPNALLSTGRRIGLSLITTRSLVRVQPSAPEAGVAQWQST